MKALWITKYGGPEVLQLRQSIDPPLEPGHVRVRVRTCGLNFAEVMARKGLYPDAPSPPCIVGYEGAGVVEDSNGVADPPAPGTRVLFLSQFGGNAEVVVVPRDQIFPMPDSLSFEEGAALPISYLTAYHALFNVARIRPGDSLLVHMAAGALGTAVLQLARTVPDITIIGTASSTKHDFAEAQGCDHVIDYHKRDYVSAVRELTGGRGVRFVLDPLGGVDWRKGYRLLTPAGMLIALGFANVNVARRRGWLYAAWQFLRVPRFTPFRLMNENRTVAGIHVGHMWDQTEMLRRATFELLDLFEAGKIRPEVGSVFPMERAGVAHELMEAGRNQGKVVLTWDDPKTLVAGDDVRLSDIGMGRPPQP